MHRPDLSMRPSTPPVRSGKTIDSCSIVREGLTVLHEPYTTARRVLMPFVPQECMRLLDIGCYAGAFGAALKADRNMEIWGVEPDRDASRIASSRLDRVLNEPLSSETDVPDHYFDVITLNDSLEHFADPVSALRVLIKKLAMNDRSRLICTLPNMRHIECIEHLLFDKDWRYAESGIRDTTHLRFFTKKSMRRLFEETGFEVLGQHGINEDWWHKDKRLRRWFFRMMPAYTDDMRYVQYVNVCRATAPDR